MVQWCWVNFRCRGVLLIWIRVGQGLTALAVGAGGGCLDILTLVYYFLSLALWETARYRLKYRLKGPLSPNQPTNTSYVLAVIFTRDFLKVNAFRNGDSLKVKNLLLEKAIFFSRAKFLSLRLATMQGDNFLLKQNVSSPESISINFESFLIL